MAFDDIVIFAIVRLFVSNSFPDWPDRITAKSGATEQKTNLVVFIDILPSPFQGFLRV